MWTAWSRQPPRWASPTTPAHLRDILTAHKDQLARPSNFWVAYPKANRADLNRDSL
jgi:hypothetical protein